MSSKPQIVGECFRERREGDQHWKPRTSSGYFQKHPDASAPPLESLNGGLPTLRLNSPNLSTPNLSTRWRRGGGGGRVSARPAHPVRPARRIPSVCTLRLRPCAPHRCHIRVAGVSHFDVQTGILDHCTVVEVTLCTSKCISATSDFSAYL